MNFLFALIGLLMLLPLNPLAQTSKALNYDLSFNHTDCDFFVGLEVPSFSREVYPITLKNLCKRVLLVPAVVIE